MHILIALVGIISAAAIWYYRVRAAGMAASDLAGAAQDVMSAARRFGFRRRYNEHPVQSLTDPQVAIAGAGLAFLELSGLPTAEQHDALLFSLQRRLGAGRDLAEEALILGRWLVAESGGASSGFTRLVKRLRQIDRTSGPNDLLAVLKDVGLSNSGKGLSPQQQEALQEVAQIYRLKG